MKKCLVIYSVWLLLHFLILWFGIAEDLFLSIVIGLPFSLLSVGLAVFAVVYPIKKYRAEKKLRWVALIPLLCILIGFLLDQAPVKEWRVICEHPLFLEKRLNEIEIARKQADKSTGYCSVLTDTPERVVAVFLCYGGDILTGTHDVVYISDDAEPTPEMLMTEKIKIYRKLSPRWYFLYREY